MKSAKSRFTGGKVGEKFVAKSHTAAPNGKAPQKILHRPAESGAVKENSSDNLAATNRVTNSAGKLVDPEQAALEAKNNATRSS